MTLKSKTKKDLRLGYSKRRHLEKGDYGCLTFSFPYIFFNKRWHQWDRAEEQLIRDLWVCWFGQVNDAGESWTKSTEAYLLLGSGWMRYCSVQIQHGESVRRGYSSSHEKAKAPKYNNASITGQPTCSYDMYGKNDLALQHFFFFFKTTVEIWF